MYYISRKVSEGIYEVTDTKDSIKENIKAKDILGVVRKGVEVKGVLKTDKGYNIKVFKPLSNFFGMKDIVNNFEIEGTILRGLKKKEVKVEIPYGITELGDYCFSDNEILQEVIIPNSVTKIGYGCFSGCKDLKKIAIPDSVTELNEHCFLECSSLRSISIPNSIIALPDSCFFCCSSLEEVYISDSVKEFGKYCFAFCEKLQKVNIPNSVTVIPDYCFDSCFSLTFITIPDSVTQLGVDCFSTCESLKKIIIPRSVKEIKCNCFGKYDLICCQEVEAEEGKSIYDGLENLTIFVYSEQAENLVRKSGFKGWIEVIS